MRYITTLWLFTLLFSLSACLPKKEAAKHTMSDHSLQFVIPSAVFDLDATIPDSYQGYGQIWKNIVKKPSDNAVQESYDFILGNNNTTDIHDPTFIGGNNGERAYFSFDGSDYYSLASGKNTQFLKDLHKNSDGSSWWLAVTLRTENEYTRNSHAGICGQVGNSSTTNGVRFSIIENVSGIRVNRYNGGNDNVAFNVDALPTINNDYLFILSYEKGTRRMRFWKNSPIASFDEITKPLHGNSDANLFEIGSGGNGGNNLLEDGYRLYSFSMGNEFLNNVQAEKIISFLEERHNRHYRQ